MTGPSLSALGGMAGAFQGAGQGLNTLLQLQMAKRQMAFAQEQARRAALEKQGIFLSPGTSMEDVLSAPGEKTTPASMQPLAGQSTTADLDITPEQKTGTPNLAQAQKSFQLDPTQPGYAAGVPFAGGMAFPTQGGEAAYARVLAGLAGANARVSAAKVGATSRVDVANIGANNRMEIAKIPYDFGPSPQQKALNEIHKQGLAKQQAALEFEIQRYNTGNSAERKLGSLASTGMNTHTQLSEIENSDPHAAAIGRFMLLKNGHGMYPEKLVATATQYLNAIAPDAIPEQAYAYQALGSRFQALTQSPLIGMRQNETMLRLMGTSDFGTVSMPDDILPLVQQDRLDALTALQAAGPPGQLGQPLGGGAPVQPVQPVGGARGPKY